MTRTVTTPAGERRIPLSRRTVLRMGSGAAAATFAGPILSGCGKQSGAEKSGEISFATWGIPSELEAFRAVIARYRKLNREATVKLEVKPPDGYQSSIETRLAAGKAPDLMRLNYADVGYYAKAGAIIDLGEHLDNGHGDEFDTTFWKAVHHEASPYALPHHTDTIALFYNVAAMEKVGATVPQTLESGWTWNQFLDVANEFRKEQVGKYAFAMNWQRYAPRWLPFLYQHGGQLLTASNSTAAIDNAKGVESIAWTKNWFDDSLVPPTTSIRSNEAIEVLFANETIPMMFNGNWLIPYLVENMTADWGVTYMIRNEQMASDLGGNAVAVTKDSNNPELAAHFLQFLTNEENMRLFVTKAQFLPVRKALLEQTLDYRQRPAEMKLFKEQAAKTIPQKLGKLLAHPQFGREIAPTVLEEQLDLAFKGDQDPETTARNIAVGIEDVLS